ncbi:sensor histidine kinase [Phytoactinopolyspora halotolerans]|uniref:histidine kinase n=1 Tax=Phytoactinopolyspora halotolerans TaxID=1981512 RepID=A0A6L9S7H1_9ACTN|nr:sensor histidine kinase [Phytoactinopolyspora halotolerans]NEE00923.1 sensor histidine kinase [Phytoactinopolyspora halotolerans]
MDPRTALESVTRRRFLLTRWPWRSLGYLVTTGLVALGAAPLVLAGLPWIVLLSLISEPGNRPGLGTSVLLMFTGLVLMVALGPLVSIPLAELERRRLRMVDDRTVLSAHREPPGADLWSWLRTRYSEAATWRELGYALLLVTVAPLAYFVVLVALVFVMFLVGSPLLIALEEGPVSLGLGEIDSPAQAIPYALAGLVLLPAVPYLFAVLAGGHGVVARALLHGEDREELRARLVDVSRSRARLVDAFEAERRRIERDLHDGAQRRLVSLTLQLGMARLDLPPQSPAAAAVSDAHEQAKQVMAELRELIRGIHPQVLTDRGLGAALRHLADEASIPVTVDVDVPERPSEHVEGTAYFVVSEALTNVAKHSGASEARVTVQRRRDAPDGDLLIVQVWDDGRGGADPERGTGLIGLADRAAVVDGRMFLSSPTGGPTVLRVELPCSPNHQHSPTQWRSRNNRSPG